MKRFMDRRAFVAAGASAAAVSFGRISGRSSAQSSRGGGKAGITGVCVFSKHLQWLQYRDMAAAARTIGFDGVDLTVRPGGHVEPGSVAAELPEAVKIIREEGLDVPMITSAVTDPDSPLTRRVLETAAGQGIKCYRMGYYRYRPEEPISETLGMVKKRMERLARLNEELGIRGSYQNHAGNGYFGSSIWDLWWVLRDLPPEWTGCQFDLRHACTESTLSWKTDLRLVAGYVNSLAVKDSRWKTGSEQGPQAEYCPLGQGFADFPAMMDTLEEASFSGPVSMHFEYPLGGAEHGAGELEIIGDEVMDAMKRDLERFRKIMSG